MPTNSIAQSLMRGGITHTQKKKKTEAIIVATPYEFVQDDQTLTVTVEPQNTQTCKEKKKRRSSERGRGK